MAPTAVAHNAERVLSASVMMMMLTMMIMIVVVVCSWQDSPSSICSRRQISADNSSVLFGSPETCMIGSSTESKGKRGGLLLVVVVGVGECLWVGMLCLFFTGQDSISWLA